MNAVLSGKAETVRAYNSRAVNDTALAYLAVLTNSYTRIKGRAITNYCILSHIGMRINGYTITNYCMVVYISKSQYSNILADGNILADMSLTADTLFMLNGMRSSVMSCVRIILKKCFSRGSLMSTSAMP